MQSVRDGLIHDATFLFRFVDSIDRFVAEHESQFTYNDATEAFFSYVRAEVKSTEKFVLDILAKAEQSSSDDGLRYRRDLAIHKDRWKIRHTYIKPAADAHTLNIPAPLINMATSHLQSVPGTQNSDIVVLLTPELMYFENRPNDPLGSGRVFLEIPYSQGSGFFGNLTVYHELGHYVWDTLSEEQPRRSAFAALISFLEKTFAEKVVPRDLSAGTRGWIKRAYDAWTQELFCDLFALRHVGPASSFALIDVLSLLGLMQDENDITFNENHPAPALRFREQRKRLEEDGWWYGIHDLPSEHIDLVNSLAAKNDSEYKFVRGDAELPWQLVNIFLAVVPLIHDLAVRRYARGRVTLLRLSDLAITHRGMPFAWRGSLEAAN